jgi:hypothetical protein
MLWKAALTWAIMAGLMIMNGAMRELLVAPRTGAYAGHVISVVTGAAIIIGLTYLFIRRLPALNRDDAWKISGLWLLLTVAFELVFFRVVESVPWTTLLADYNILRGRLWLVILLTVVLAPVLWQRHFRETADLKSLSCVG